MHACEYFTEHLNTRNLLESSSVCQLLTALSTPSEIQTRDPTGTPAYCSIVKVLIMIVREYETEYHTLVCADSQTP